MQFPSVKLASDLVCLGIRPNIGIGTDRSKAVLIHGLEPFFFRGIEDVPNPG